MSKIIEEGPTYFPKTCSPLSPSNICPNKPACLSSICLSKSVRATTIFPHKPVHPINVFPSKPVRPRQVMFIPVNLFVLVMIAKGNPLVLSMFVCRIQGLL